MWPWRKRKVIQVVVDLGVSGVKGHCVTENRGEVVEDGAGGAETKRKSDVEVVRVLPAETEEPPLRGMDGDEPEGMLEVGFGHEGFLRSVWVTSSQKGFLR